MPMRCWVEPYHHQARGFHIQAVHTDGARGEAEALLDAGGEEVGDGGVFGGDREQARGFHDDGEVKIPIKVAQRDVAEVWRSKGHDDALRRYGMVPPMPKNDLEVAGIVGRVFIAVGAFTAVIGGGAMIGLGMPRLLELLGS